MSIKIKINYVIKEYEKGEEKMNTLCQYLLKYSNQHFINPISDYEYQLYKSLLLQYETVDLLCDTNGNTPLHFAWMSGQSKLIIPLMELGAKYSKNYIRCFDGDLGFFPVQMSQIIDQLWRVKILDPEGFDLIDSAVSKYKIDEKDEEFYTANFISIEKYWQFFARHHSQASMQEQCGDSCVIVKKMMSGEIDCDHLIENI